MLGASHTAKGQTTNDWLGNLTNTWNLSGNWTTLNAGGVPLSGDFLVFDAAGTAGTALNNDLTNSTFVLGGLTFNSDASAYTISGNAFTLAGSIVNNSANTQIINDAITLGTGVQTITTTNSGGNIILGGILSGTDTTSGIALTGGGSLILTAANTYVGPTNVQNGTLILGTASGTATGSLSSSTAVTLGTGTTKGILQLGDASNTVNQTVASLTNGSFAGSAVVSGSNGTSTLTINNSAADTFSGVIGGTGTNNNNLALTKSGAGNLTLSGNSSNTYTGVTTVTAGTLTLAKNAGFNAVGGNIVMTGGTLTWSTQNQIPDTASLTLSGTAIVAQGITETLGSISVTGGAGKFNPGSGTNLTVNSLVFTNLTSALTNSYSLAANSSNSTMTIGSGGWFVTGSIYAIGQAGLNIPTVQLQGNFTGTGTNVISAGVSTTDTKATIDLQAGTRTFDIQGTTTIGPKITNGSLIKTDTGTLILTGANTFAGGTTISGGVLTGTQTSGTPFGTGSLSINNATLSIAPTGTSTVALSGANTATGTTFTYGPASILSLAKGTNTSLSYTIGNAAPSGAVLVRNTSGTLVINESAAGTLGVTEDFVVNGLTSANNFNGIYSPSIIAQSGSIGTFAKVDTTATNGFDVAEAGTSSYTTHAGSFTTALNEIADVTAAATITNGASGANAYALRVGAVTATVSGTVTINGLAAGSGNSGLAGIILNPTTTASTITGGTLAFGSSEGLIYVGSGTGGGSISSAITGTAGVTTFGPGTLTLGGTNTFTGGLNINGNTVSVSSDARLGASTNGINLNGGTLLTTANITLGSGRVMTLSANGGTQSTTGTNISLTIGAANQITGTGAFTHTGSTTTSGIIINAAQNYSGGTYIPSGRIQLNNASATLGSGDIHITGGEIYATAAVTIPNKIFIQDNGTEGRGAVRLAANGIALTGPIVLTNNAGLSSDATNTTTTISGNISGAFTLSLGTGTSPSTTATYLVSGNNSQSGTTLGAGTLNINADAALGISNGTLTLNNSSILQAGAAGIVLNASRPIVIANTPSIDTQANSMTVASVVSSTGGLTKLGTGTLTLSNANTYTGDTSVSAGTLNLSNSLALGGSSLATAGIVFDQSATSHAFTFGGLKGSGNIALQDNAPTPNAVALTVGVNNQSNTFSGSLSGPGSLIKSGTGTEVFAAGNSYTGTTTINAGILQAATTASIPGYNTPAIVTVNSGATFAVNAGGSGQWASTDIDTALANVTFTTGSNLGIDTTGGNFSYGTNVAGILGITKLGANTLTLTGANSYTGTTAITAGTLATASGGLPATAVVSFSGASTLDIGNLSQTVSKISVNDGVTATLTGVGGSLTINGAADFDLSDNATSASSRIINASGLTSLTYNSPANNFAVGGPNATSIGASNVTDTLTLAATNNITASSFLVGNSGHSNNGQVVATVNLGQTNTIDANTFNVGLNKAAATLQFSVGLAANPTLVLRGTDGVGRVSSMTIGSNSSNANNDTALVDLTTGVTGTSVLDALVTSLTIGSTATNTTTNHPATGTFLMGSGTLDATTIIIGQNSGSISNATGLLSVTGGTVKVGTLTLGDRSGASTGTVSATFNLNTGSTLAAQTVQAGGSAVGTPTRVFNWNDGTIQNYDATTDLSITGLTLTLASTGNHAFNIGAGRTGTLASTTSITGGGNLTSSGNGTLVLGGTANNYTGTTSVNAGSFLVTGSISGTTAVTVAPGATLGGTGTVAVAGTTSANNIAVATGGTIAPGTASGIGTLTFDATNTTAANLTVLSLASGAQFSFKLNSGLLSDSVALTNAASGDSIAFGGNVINFLDLSSGALSAGSYTLFTSNVANGFSGLQLDGSNFITSGLSIGSGLSAYPSSTLQEVGNSIVLNLVPEPSAAASLLGGMGLLAGLGRFGRRRIR